MSTYRDYSLYCPRRRINRWHFPPANNWKASRRNPPAPATPAVFLMLAAPANASKSDPSVIHDAEKNTWSVVLPLPLRIKGQNEDVPFPVRLVVIGAAAA